MRIIGCFSTMVCFLLVGSIGCGDKEPQKKAPKKETTTQTKSQSDKAPKQEEVKTASGPGKELYVKNCQQCHMADGNGLEEVYPPLAGSAWPVKEFSVPVRIVLHGLKGDLTVKGVKYGAMQMEPHKDKLNDQEVADVLNFVRTSWGNKGSEISAEQVKQVRDKYKDRTDKWTVAELDAK